MRNNQKELEILYEDKDIIVCIKPAGVPSQSDKSYDYDMVNRLKNYICDSDECEGQPYIGVVHRLDRPVGGIMVFGKNDVAVKKLNEQIRNKKMNKSYIVVSDAKDIVMDNEWHNLKDYLVKNPKTNTSSVTNKNNKNAKLSELNYKVVAQATKNDKLYSLIEVQLLTGRHHQIRVQLSNANMAIWGDTKYNKDFISNNPQLKWANIALFSYKLEFVHPITNEKMSFKNKPCDEMFGVFAQKKLY